MKKQKPTHSTYENKYWLSKFIPLSDMVPP
jgi:hypothetical protein